MMKVFFRKEPNGRIKELNFYSRMIDETVELTVIKAHVDDIHGENVETLYTQLFPSVLSFNTMLENMTVRLNSYGWGDDYDVVKAARFNSYPDGVYLPSKVTRAIDSFENIEFPVFVHEKPQGYQDVYFADSFREEIHGFRDLIGSPDENTVSSAKKIQHVVRSPFNCYIKGNEIIVHDIMMLDTPYSIRHNLFTELEGTAKTITPTKIESLEELEAYCKDKEQVVIMGGKSLYTPSYSAPFAYLYTQESYDEGIVLDVDSDTLICADPSFESIFKVKEDDLENLRISDVVKYTKDAKLESTI
jgi:hypothetical protein